MANARKGSNAKRSGRGSATAGKSKSAPTAAKVTAPRAADQNSASQGSARESMARKQAGKGKAPAAKRTPPARTTTRAKKPMRGAAKSRVGKLSAASSTSLFERVAFTLLPVQDAKRARAFYEEVLGLQRGLASSDGTWTEYDLPGGGCIALFRHPDASAPSRPGSGALALEVSDLDALNLRLQAAGVVYRGGIVHGPNCRMSNIEDSEGNGLILHQLNQKRHA